MTATDGTFTISRAALWDAWRRGRLTWDTEVMSPSATDPDAFTLHGSEHALDRWADDGGRAWVREEALNFDKVLGEMMGGGRRLDFVEWKARRDATAAEFPAHRIARGEG